MSLGRLGAATGQKLAEADVAVGHFGFSTVLRPGRRIGRPPESPRPGHLQAVDQTYYSDGEHGADGDTVRN
jgi:hypothetical protein